MLKKNTYTNGVIFCLIATLSWGTMFPIMNYALKFIDPFTFTALRYTLAGIVFLFFLNLKEDSASLKIDENMFLLWLFGSAGFAGFGFFVFLGQKLAGPEGALSASMMMATMPLLGLFVNWILKGNRPPSFSFAFILMSFFGVILVITKGNISLIFTAPSNYSANLLMIAGALCWVLYTVGATYFPKWSPIKYTALSTLLGLPTIYVVTGGLIFSGQIIVPDAHVLLKILPALIYMSLFAGFIGVLCWNYGNKILTPINGVLFMDVVPITAFLLSTLLGVIPSKWQVLGVTLTASALIFNNLYQRRRLAIKTNAVLSKA